MTTEYTVIIDDSYVTPEGALDKAQYVNMVMNKAAESYMKGYAAADFEAGIQSALDAYNAALPEEAADD